MKLLSMVECMLSGAGIKGRAKDIFAAANATTSINPFAMAL